MGDCITGVRIIELKKNGDVLTKYPHNKGSGIIIEGDYGIEIKVDGKWQKIWKMKISSGYVMQ